MLAADTPEPLVSIIMPAYNAAETILRSIESVRRQTYPNWELVVVDDASTDSTAAVVEAVGDARIRLIRAAANGGRGRARNLALDTVRGGIVTFLDADDAFDDELLAGQLMHLAGVPECDAVGCAFRRIGADGTVYRERLGNDVEVYDPFRFVFGFPAFLQGTFYRREALGDLRFVEGVYGEDVDFNLRFALTGHLFGYNRRLLWDYHETPQARSKTTLQYCRDQIATVTRNESLIRSWHAGDAIYQAALARVVLKVAARSLATGQTGNLPQLKAAYGAVLDRAPSWIALQEGRDIARWRRNYGTFTVRHVLADVLGQRTFGDVRLVAVALGGEVVRGWRRVGGWRRGIVARLQRPLAGLVKLRRVVRGTRRRRGVTSWWSYDTLMEKRLKRRSRRVGGETSIGWDMGFGPLSWRSAALARWIAGACAEGHLTPSAQRVVDAAPRMAPVGSGAHAKVLQAVAFGASPSARSLALASAVRGDAPVAVTRLLLQSARSLPEDGVLCRRLLRRSVRQPFLARDLVVLGAPWRWLARASGLKPRGSSAADASWVPLARASLMFEMALIASALDDAEAIFSSIAESIDLDARVKGAARRRNPKQHERLSEPARLLEDFFTVAGPDPAGPFVIAGSLLGQVREGRVIAHDNDIDVGALGTERYDAVRQRLAADPRFVFVDRGVDSCCRFRHLSGGRVDFYRLEPWQEGWIMRGPTVAWAFPRIELEPATMNGVTVAAPRDATEILESMYGDWQTPDAAFDSRIQAHNLVPDAGWYGSHGWRILWLELMAQGRVDHAHQVAEAASSRGERVPSRLLGSP